jgi:GNAT superfamily N-acetyltransferase
VTGDEELREYVKLATGTFFHLVGTCPIGTTEGAVVDPGLRVRGIGAPRVADASVSWAIYASTSPSGRGTVSSVSASVPHGTSEDASPGLSPASSANTATKTRPTISPASPGTLGDHRAPVGVTGEHDGIVDRLDELGEAGRVAGERAQRVGERDHPVHVTGDLRDDIVPARGLGEGAVYEDDRWIHDDSLHVAGWASATGDGSHVSRDQSDQRGAPYDCNITYQRRVRRRRRRVPGRHMSETELEIRPIEPGDKAALAAAVDQSSDEAVYRRFLNPHGRLTASELRYLTEVDHRDHEALLAVDPGSSKSVGVARYVRDRERRDSAEIAVAVLETWQGRGVGKALLHRLADRARDEGITQFTALMLSDNRPMRRLLADLGKTRLLSSEAGAVELAVDLFPTPPATREKATR